MTGSLARAAARRPWLTIGLWAAAFAASIAVIMLLLGSALTSEQEVTNNPESAQADELIAEGFAGDGAFDYTDEVVVVRGPNATAKAREVRAALTATGAVHRFQTVQTSPNGAVAMPLAMAADPQHDPEETIEEVVAVVQASDTAPHDVSISGIYTLDRDFLTLSEEDLQKGELFFGLPAALIIVMLVFGAIVAGLVPLLLAIVAIVVALALTAFVGQAFDLSIFVVNMLTGMGLALGIDYSLFVLSRFREEREAGSDKLEAIGVAGDTSSRAVLFSGIAFVLALLGMVVIPDTIMRSLGTGAILVGIVAVLAALTLLPAVLSLLGDRINSLRIPFIRTSGVGEGRFWSASVRAIMRRPVVSLVASVAVLLALSVPVLQLETGFAGISTLPDRFASKQGFVAYQEEFGGGATQPALVVVEGDIASPPVQEARKKLEAWIAQDDAFGPPEAQVSESGRIAVLRIPVKADPASERAVSAVERLRADYIPAALEGVDARALVTGETAGNIDYFALIDHWLPIVFAFVLGLSFVLLTLAFRSIVVPLKAIALNLLSVGAAYGLLVLVFQKGIGNELFGFQHVETVEAWVPLFLFSVLFGLSMDYHVFLLSRIRERFVATGDNDDAVAYGVGSTARLITGAALIIVAVFSGFARGDLVMFQQMGFGVAVSLLIDATIVRSVLLPASMKLLGERNWYFPRRLRWLPDLGHR